MSTTAAAEADRGTRKRTSRVEMVMDHIKDAVTSGQLKEGNQLPTEFELARHLGVSRTPVREAIKILDMVGILEVRHGSGTFVRKGVQTALAQLMLFQTYLRDTTPQKLMEVRQVFEKSCAELAAERRTEDNLRAMRECIDRLRTLADDPSASQDEILEADLDFHRQVYRAANNELLESVANFVLSMVAPWISKSVERTGAHNTARLHEVMYLMIENSNANAAREFAVSRGFGYGDPVDANMLHFRDMITE